MEFWERASSRMVKATIFSRILLRNYNLFVATAVVVCVLLHLCSVVRKIEVVLKIHGGYM